MTHLSRCVSLYLGCNTNKGKLIGIVGEVLIVENEKSLTQEYNITDLGETLFLHLMQLSDLTHVQSKELIEEGFSIGRPHGYTFSNNGFLYLLSLCVDLFGLIKSGYAKEIKSLTD
jgi:hypothetical protein